MSKISDNIKAFRASMDYIANPPQKPEPFYELTRDDVGKAMIRAFGKVWLTSNFIGNVLSSDVGKRVYVRGGGDILQIENDEQRAARLGTEVHYELTDAEHRAISSAGPGAVFDRPEMLCRTGSWHAGGTRNVDLVTCGRCKQALKTFKPYRGEN